MPTNWNWLYVQREDTAPKVGRRKRDRRKQRRRASGK